MHEHNLRNIHSNLISHLKPKVEYPYDLALVLIAFAIGKTKTWVLSHQEYKLNQQETEKISSLEYRLLNGEPLSYILGEKEFYKLKFFVDQNVLIPRPETELLVEQALSWLTDHPQMHNALDVGTGSGCIAITLAKFKKDIQIIATDISHKALKLAKKNAIHNQVSNQVFFVQADLTNCIHKSFNLICANLPYIPISKLPEVNSLAFEPHLALYGGEDGLLFITELLQQLEDKLLPRALILLEIEEHTGLRVKKLATKYFPSAKVEIIKDYAEKDRILKIQL